MLDLILSPVIWSTDDDVSIQLESSVTVELLDLLPPRAIREIDIELVFLRCLVLLWFSFQIV